MHATDFLQAPDRPEIGPIVVLAGPVTELKISAMEALRLRILGEDEQDDLGYVRLDGAACELVDVVDELHMRSMFSSSKLVQVHSAGDFVKRHRSGLEQYLSHPARDAVLVLDVNSWPKTTRLAKLTAKAGLTLECTELKGAALRSWLIQRAESVHHKQLSASAADLMLNLAGTEMGLLTQELAKLASYAGDQPRIEEEDVSLLVGGWRTETTWVMLNALRDGRLDQALENLERLLVAGEPLLKVFGGLTFVFRKYAIATELSRQGTPLGAALRSAGVFPRDVAASESYLRRIGRPEAERIYGRLQAADEDLKGRSAAPERILMERLFVELCGRRTARA